MAHCSRFEINPELFSLRINGDVALLVLKKTVDAELVSGPLHEISEFRTINYDGVVDTSYT